MVKYTQKQKLAYYKRIVAGRRKAYSSYNRPYRRIRGRGDYVVDSSTRKKRSWSAPKTFAAMGEIAGSALGNVIAPGVGGAVGGIAGQAFGDKLGRFFRHITGWGDYQIKSNSIVHPGQEIPEFGPGRTCIRVQHKEYITKINSSTDFNLLSFDINPGLDSTFPWLSGIARQFQQYHINGLVFGFVSTSADSLSSTNTALGKVIMATDYNAADPDFINMQQMMGSEFSSMSKPSESFLHAVECDPSETPLKLYYVRNGVLDDARDHDKLMYDLGVFQIATEGSQAVAEIGDLWVTYDITFCKPQQNNVIGLDLETSHWVMSGPTTTATMGTSRELRDGSNLDCEFSQDTIYFPETLSAGRYKISYSVFGSSVSLNAPTRTLTNCTLVNSMFIGATTGVLSNSGATDDIFIMEFMVDIDDINASVKLSGGTLPAGGAQVGDLYITQVPSDLA